LFLQFFSAYREGRSAPADLKTILRAYCMEHLYDFTYIRTRELYDPGLCFARDIVMNADTADLRYLYYYGEYITENEIRTAAFLNTLTEEEIDSIARTWTEGYRIGFVLQNKPLNKKKSAFLEYRIGFERVIKAAIRQLGEMGLESIICRRPSHMQEKRYQARGGFTGTDPNGQFSYDWREVSALFMDETFVKERLKAQEAAFEQIREKAETHAGPLVMEVFGEALFHPQAKESAPRLSREQEQLQVRFRNAAGEMTNRYIHGEERSFTIIAYPVPEIGDRFEEIFRETIRINNLDQSVYGVIQQKLIDALDRGRAVHVKGSGGNQTDLTVCLHELADPDRQTNFENCLADVNIPLGEVFTSPVLEGTKGLLHVSSVVLNDLPYENLKLRLDDGMITEYSCSNFEDPEEGRRYIEENLLFHHKTLPIGEFAVGTNTTAYRMAHDFAIEAVLPILIAEKTGPHFAFGDTCYSRQEDVAVFNPDGKEIIARENSCSALRKEEPEKAYFNCHTDVTIPYNELGSVTVLCRDGSETALIEKGRFVLPGTEELNKALD
ncbi:MAG: aminopeptidase, partial [Eubacterium sp.]|nr:aminopeptidase [Eubacterium sp.]